MFDGEQAGDGGIVSRRRGRHAAAAAGVTSDGSRRGRVRALIAALTAVIEPRLAASGAWVFERRAHALVIAASVAAVALISGTLALVALSRVPQAGGEAATLVDEMRPTSSEPGAVSTFPPILPTPVPTPPPASDLPNPPTPESGPGEPVADAPPEPSAESNPAPGGPADEPEGEPGDEEHPRDTAPGATNRPDKPGKG